MTSTGKRTGKRAKAETIRFIAQGGDSGKMSPRFASLVVQKGADADLGVHVLLDRPVTIGRDSDLELPLLDGTISRRHCLVDRERDGPYVLHDLGSRNGTRHNGKQVSGPTPLAEGDKIFLGASVLKFTWADAFDVEYLAKLEAMVSTDELTGLQSKRRFDSEFEAAVVRARERGEPLAVLVIDMDHLKNINDTHGHAFGGFAIAETGRIVKATLGDDSVVSRFGGDEFVALLPGHDRAAGVARAEDVRLAVHDHAFVKDEVQLHPTVSIGVAAFPEDGETSETLFLGADAALYRAKGSGKDRVST